MLQPVLTSFFQKDVKRIERRGYDMKKMKEVISLVLLNRRPQTYRDHPLRGKWKPKWELHIEPDWLLIYQISGEQCFFARTGTHADLFSLLLS